MSVYLAAMNDQQLQREGVWFCPDMFNNIQIIALLKGPDSHISQRDGLFTACTQLLV